MARTLALVAIVLALVSLQFVAAGPSQPPASAPADLVDQAMQQLAAWPAPAR